MDSGFKKRMAILGAVFGVVATIAFAAAGFDRLKDHVKIGGGVDSTKTVEFDVGAGGSNPKITATSAGIVSTGGELVPAGSVMSYAGSSAPAGWLLCYGQAVSRTTYASLFAAIGTTYGSGDGSTTFNLPDLRGRTVAGDDDMGGAAANRLTNANTGITGTTLGAAGGAEAVTGTIGGSQSIAHTHTIAHVHIWTFFDANGTEDWFTRYQADNSSTSISTGVFSDGEINWASYFDLQYTSGATSIDFVDPRSPSEFTNSDRTFYTTGAVSAASGSGSTAASGAMSANSTVSGSNFTFTDGTGGNAQPTIVLNYIIKA